MKHNKVFRILALAVVLSLLLLAIPATPALGAITFTLSSYSGPVATVITVSGSGFAVSSSGYVWFDTNGNSAIDAGEPQLSVTTITDVLPAGITLTVPTVPRATYYVRADVPSVPAGTIEAYASFTVTPKITLSASTGNVGDTVTVSGNGFAATAGITILFDDVSKGTTTTTTTGTFSSVTFTVPDSVKGSHTVKAQETSATTNYTTATFTVSPEITLDPASGAVGDEVTVTGTGFAASSDIIISFDGDEVDIGGDDSTSSKGSFESTFDVPEASRGGHTVKAEDEDDNYATATFTVGQKITIDPTSGSSGTTVTVTGTGFRASKPITIYYDDEEVTTSPAVVTTSSAGYFTATFTVPSGLASTYVVAASDGSYSATANFVSTTDATISQTTTAAAPGYVGMELTITGVGFTPESTVTITYATTPVALETVTIDDSGNFSVTITIPASTKGTHAITVTGTTAGTPYFTKSFTFYMESEAPPVPSLVLPAVGTKLEEGGFDWADVTDAAGSDPVTYDFQVAADSTFATPLLDKTGLDTSAYTLLEAEKLDSTSKDEPYYWRVRAVDAASNTSAWSSAGTFSVGIGIMAWLPYILMVVIAIVFFVFGVWVGKRSGGY
jgi:hypothetical protein